MLAASSTVPLLSQVSPPSSSAPLPLIVVVPVVASVPGPATVPVPGSSQLTAPDSVSRWPLATSSVPLPMSSTAPGPRGEGAGAGAHNQGARVGQRTGNRKCAATEFQRVPGSRGYRTAQRAAVLQLQRAGRHGDRAGAV